MSDKIKAIARADQMMTTFRDVFGEYGVDVHVDPTGTDKEGNPMYTLERKGGPLLTSEQKDAAVREMVFRLFPDWDGEIPEWTAGN